MTPVANWDDLDEPIEIVAGRTCDWSFKLWKPNKKAAAIHASAVVRFKLSTEPDGAPLLDIDSVGALVGGSIVTIIARGTDEVTPAEATVRFAQDDTAELEPGEYFGELGVVDSAETNPLNAFKRAGCGTVIVKAAPGGDVGLT